MQQLTFGQIMQILIRNMKPTQYGNQADLVKDILAAYIDDLEQSDYVFDPASVNRCLHDSGGLNSKIPKFYDSDEREAELAEHLEDNIFPRMASVEQALLEMQNLLILDPTIHEQEKRRMLQMDLDASFLAKLLRYTMTYDKGRRERRKPPMSEDGVLSPVVKNYISADYLPHPCKWFQGRKEEAERLHRLLTEKHHVFLRGIPGIGKSELAKYYAQNYRKLYTNVLYINSTGDLKRDIAGLGFADDILDADMENRYLRHNQFLRTLLEDSLLIFDNFNVSPEDAPLLSQVLSYRCRILFTTRCTYADYDTMVLMELPEKDLIPLVNWFYRVHAGNFSVIQSLVRTVYSHTLSVEMAARLLFCGLRTPEQLVQALLEDGPGMEDPNVISIKKDGKTRKATYYTHIHKIFGIYQLEGQRRSLMSSMTLMPDKGISIQGFAELNDIQDANDLSALANYGLVVVDDRRFLTLHPMIREVALMDLKPNLKSCPTFSYTIHSLFLIHGLEFQGFGDIMEILRNILRRGKLDKDSLLFLEDAWCFAEKYQAETVMEDVVKAMQTILADPKVGKPDDRALLLNYEAYGEKDLTKAISKARQALELLGKVTRKNGDLASNLHCNLGYFYNLHHQYALAKTELEAAIGLHEKYQYDAYHDLVNQYRTYSAILGNLGEYDRSYEIQQQLAQVIAEHESDQSLDYADVMENLGRFCMNQKRTDEAERYFGKALGIYENVFRDQPETLAPIRQRIELMTKLLPLVK